MDAGNVLQKKIGPLPAFAWLAVVGGGVWFARRIGQAQDTPSATPSADSPVAVTDAAYGDPVQFPSGQLVPITGDEHLAPTSPYVTIPAPAQGGVVITPGGEYEFQPLPAPTASDPPAAPPTLTPTPTATLSYFGKTYTAGDKWAFLRDWKLDRSRRKWQYGVLQWDTFLNRHPAIVRFFKFGGSRVEWARVQI